MNNSKLKIVQTILPLEKIEALKAKSGKNNIKDALSEAVYHYINCPFVNEIYVYVCVSKIRGRKPLYLKEIMTDHVPNKRRREDLGR